MRTAIRIIGLGIWVAILSMMITAFFLHHATEQDVTDIFVVIVDFIVIGFVARAVLKIFRNQRG